MANTTVNPGYSFGDLFPSLDELEELNKQSKEKPDVCPSCGGNWKIVTSFRWNHTICENCGTKKK